MLFLPSKGRQTFSLRATIIGFKSASTVSTSGTTVVKVMGSFVPLTPELLSKMGLSTKLPNE